MSRIRVAAAALLMMVSGSTFAAGPGLPLPIPTLPGVALPALGLGVLPGIGALPTSLPALPFAPPEGIVVLLGNLTLAMGPYGQQLPLVGLVNMGDPMLRPLISQISGPVYLPVLGAAFGTN